MSAVASRSGCSKSLYCYNQLQQYLRHCTVFWLKWPVHDLVLVTPPPPLFKVASNTRPCSKLGGTTLNGGRRGVSILSHRLVTSSDLKQDRLLFHECLNIFATGCSFDFGQPRHCQNIFQLDLYKRHNSLFISFSKMVCNVF